jgi:uncharacterized protein YndB with AHSA1/START domain
MIQFTVETEIRRPPKEVFAYVTEPTKLATWQTNTVSAKAQDDGLVRRGLQVAEPRAGP